MARDRRKGGYLWTARAVRVPSAGPSDVSGTTATPTPRPIVEGALMSAASRVGVTVAGAVASIVIARLLGPDGAGGYFVAQYLVLLLAAAVTLGVEHGIAYFVSTGAWAPRAAYRSALAMAAVTGLVGAVAGIALRLLFPTAFAGLPVWMVAISVIAVPFALAWIYQSFVAVAIDRYEAFVLPPLAQAYLALALVVPGAIVFELGGAVAGMTIATVAVGSGAVVWAWRRLPALANPRSEEPRLRRAVSFGIKGYAANALQLLNYRLDLFILAAVASTATVGVYAVAVAATSVVGLLPSALSEVLFPRVAHLDERNDQQQLELVETKSLRHGSLVVIAATLAVAAALELFVVPIYGEAFRDAIELGLILLPGVALLGIASILASTIVGRGKPIYSLYALLVSTPATIVLYATLIPAFDANGAALASTLSYAFSFVLLCGFYRRATGRSAFPYLVPTRSELDDIRALPRVVVSWGRALRE